VCNVGDSGQAERWPNGPLSVVSSCGEHRASLGVVVGEALEVDQPSSSTATTRTTAQKPAGSSRADRQANRDARNDTATSPTIIKQADLRRRDRAGGAQRELGGD
jgi:hypothetical protein